MSQSTVDRCVLGHAEEQEENKNAVHPFPSRGRQAYNYRGQFCRRHLHSSPATAQRLTLKQGMTSQVERGVGIGE